MLITFFIIFFDKIIKTFKTKSYCAFIDFKKALDSMWRVGLRTKILLNNTNGKFLNVIRELNIVYFVCYFCTVGVR